MQNSLEHLSWILGTVYLLVIPVNSAKLEQLDLIVFLHVYSMLSFLDNGSDYQVTLCGLEECYSHYC